MVRFAVSSHNIVSCSEPAMVYVVAASPELLVALALELLMFWGLKLKLLRCDVPLMPHMHQHIYGDGVDGGNDTKSELLHLDVRSVLNQRFA